MNPCLSAFGSFEFSLLLCAILQTSLTRLFDRMQTRRRTRRTRIVSTVRSAGTTSLKVPHPTQPRSTYYAWLIQNCYCFTLLLYSHYDRTCMVVCLLDGLYLDATLPLLTLLLGQTHACCYILLILLLCLYYIDAWWKLVLSGLQGECYVCDMGAWRVRVVSTKLEYTMSLGQVLPQGATWARLDQIPVVGKWNMRWPWV